MKESYVFKIGQEVTVRKDLKYDKRYCMRSGPGKDTECVGVATSMHNRGGEKVHIARYSCDKYDIVEDGGPCWWTDEMFEESDKNCIFHGVI